MGLARSPNGFNPEKSAAGSSCGGSAALFAPVASARDETAAALCRNRRRVLDEFVGISVFSMVEKDLYLAKAGVVKELQKKPREEK
jgi:hypothetical protein